MRRITPPKIAVLVTAFMMFTALTAVAGAVPSCDVDTDVCTLDPPKGQNFKLGFDAFVQDGDGSATIVGATTTIPPNPIKNASCKIAEGKLYLADSTDVIAIGRVIPPNPIRFETRYLFDGHLVPASSAPFAIPPNPIRFLGNFFIPPNPIRC